MDWTPLLAAPALPWALAASLSALLVLALVVSVWRARVLRHQLAALGAAQDQLARDWSHELEDRLREVRQDVLATLAELRHEGLHRHDALQQFLAQDAALTRAEQARGLDRFAGSLADQWRQLSEQQDRRLHDMQQSLQAQWQSLREQNRQQLEDMRQLVDEKLHATLEKRLGESFRLVSERLEAVHRGLGDMQQLAAGVGDLQRVLVNVKSRGIWGEVQLARLIEDLMTPDQYAYQVRPIPGQSEVVECAIRLPGHEPQTPVWLPIDAKFPREAFERLQEAHEAGDEDALRRAGQVLEKVVETEARRIAGKYVAPPHTTDFAVMFLPTESLYAEVLRRPGLFDRLLSLRITVTGPSTLAAMLNSLQMGFRTLAIEERSAEVWQVLRGVKTEFQKFGEALASVKKSLDTASHRIGTTEVRTRAMLRSLRQVEVLPGIPDESVALPDDDEETAVDSPDAAQAARD